MQAVGFIPRLTSVVPPGRAGSLQWFCGTSERFVALLGGSQQMGIYETRTGRAVAGLDAKHISAVVGFGTKNLFVLFGSESGPVVGKWVLP